MNRAYLPMMSLRALVLTSLTACGGASVFPDAAAIDATADDAGAVDGSIDGRVDGAPGTATVTVHVRTADGTGAPDPSATVFFVDPDGTIAAQANPDATGTVTRTMMPGGSVTVGHDATDLTTIVGVEDGDDLTFGRLDIIEDQQLTVTVPARAGAANYVVRGPCMSGASGSTTITTRFAQACGATHPLLLSSASLGMPPFYLVAPAVTPTSGGQLAVTGTWAASTPATVELTGLPAGATDLSATRYLLVAGAEADRVLDTSIPIAAGAATASFATPVGFGDRVRLEVRYRDADDRFYRLQLFRPSLVEAAPLDVAPAIPQIATTDHPGAEVSWTLAGAGAFDAVVVTLEDVDPQSESLLAAWRVIAPSTATAVTLPALPAPFDVATIPLTNVRLVETSAIADYAAFRREAGAGIWIDQPPTPAPVDARWAIRNPY